MLFRSLRRRAEAAHWLRRRVLRAPPGTRAQRPAPRTAAGRKAAERSAGVGRPRREAGGRGTGARRGGGTKARKQEDRRVGPRRADWGQSYVWGVTRNGSPVPSARIRVKGRRPGEALGGASPRCPQGGVGVRLAVQAGSTLWGRGPRACRKCGGNETERGDAGVMGTTQRSSTEPGAGSGSASCFASPPQQIGRAHV